MKKYWMLSLALLTLPLAGCEDDEADTVIVERDRVPATPQGVFSVTGDGAVYVYWNGIYESDVDYYRVYRSLNATTNYAPIASVDAESNPNLDLIIYDYTDNAAANGTTYWYAVTAVDYAGQESELSAEDVFDTPRPEGVAVVLSNDIDENLAGFNFATHQVVNWTSLAADIFADRFEGVSYVNAANDLTDIQDLGYTNDFSDVGWSPTSGWSSLGYCEAIVGHTYIVWTSDDHYAKIRITSISLTGAIAFEWAWQSVEGNLELAPPARPVHTDEFGQDKRTVAGQLIK